MDPRFERPSAFTLKPTTESISSYLADSALRTLVLLVAIILSSHLVFGFGTRKARELFIGLLLFTMISVQYYYLAQAVMHVPASRFYVYDPSLTISDCLSSGKGGKRPSGAVSSEYINPCFCHSSAVCYSSSGSVISGNCPQDGSATCIETATQRSVPLYIPDNRNCLGGFGTTCSLNQPCDPCDLSYIVKYGSSRCRTCSASYNGNCNFIEGVGPYCYVESGKKQSVACKQCCTTASVMIINGTCY